MSNQKVYSRADRHQKKQKQKRKIIFFFGLGALFCIILFSLIAFGGMEDREDDHTKSQAETAVEHQESNYTISEKSENEQEEFDLNNQETEEVDEKPDIQEVATNDVNVKKAYEGDWKPIGTTQTGEHVTDYNDNSSDRKEIKQAVSVVTDIDEENMIEHWVGNGGEQKVEATVSERGTEKFYRVFLSWIDKEGWQVTRLEHLEGI